MEIVDTGSPTGNVGLGVGAATIVALAIKFWTPVSEFLKSRADRQAANNKTATENKLHENDIALNIYKDLVNEWKGQVVGLNDSLRKQDAEHSQCRAESAVQKERIEQLEGENTSLKAKVENLETRLLALETKPQQGA